MTKATLRQLAMPEFIALMATLVAIVAFSIDIMLPAFGSIASDLNMSDDNDVHLIVTMLFLGLAMGQFVAGPLSDRYGRRTTIHIGAILFITGTVISGLAVSLHIMLVGRLLQGIGAAAPRIVTLSIIRDCYSGKEMARIMSVITAVFIVVPMLAPLIGQVILSWANWRMSFVFLLTVAIITWAWFSLRQPETLTEDSRREISLINLRDGLFKILRDKEAVAYSIASGLVLGGFIGYLSISQKTFQLSYDTGTSFVGWFALISFFLGASSLLNAKLVNRYPMTTLCRCALAMMCMVSAPIVIYILVMHEMPAFYIFIVWLSITMSSIGILFGNLSAMAMQNLGEMAGLGATLVNTISMMIAIPISLLIGHFYDGGVFILISSFTIISVLGYWVVVAAKGQG